jgi:hypothetical protein
MQGWAAILTNDIQEREIPAFIRVMFSDHTHVVELIAAASVRYGLYIRGKNNNQIGHLAFEIRGTKNL